MWSRTLRWEGLTSKFGLRVFERWQFEGQLAINCVGISLCTLFEDILENTGCGAQTVCWPHRALGSRVSSRTWFEEFLENIIWGYLKDQGGGFLRKHYLMTSLKPRLKLSKRTLFDASQRPRLRVSKRTLSDELLETKLEGFYDYTVWWPPRRQGWRFLREHCFMPPRDQG